MKIIKHGNLVLPELMCKKCKCVFEYDEKDINKESVCDNYLQIHGMNYWVVCPECGQIIKLNPYGGDIL